MQISKLLICFKTVKLGVVDMNPKIKTNSSFNNVFTGKKKLNNKFNICSLYLSNFNKLLTNSE